MCGRFYIDDHTIKEIANVAPETNDAFWKGKCGDIYPSQSALVLTGRTAHLSAEEMKWGFPQYQRKAWLSMQEPRPSWSGICSEKAYGAGGVSFQQGSIMNGMPEK